MFSQKFKELEEKIKNTAELVARLRQENKEWEKKYQAAEKRIREMEAELQRIRDEQTLLTPTVQSMLQQLDGAREEAPEKTIHTLQERAAQEPNNYRVYFDLGYAYEKQGQYEKAIAEYKKALKIKPDSLEATEHLAFLLEKLSRDQEASPLWERILSLKKRR